MSPSGPFSGFAPPLHLSVLVIFFFVLFCGVCLMIFLLLSALPLVAVGLGCRCV